jgi:hypothetical protein
VANGQRCHVVIKIAFSDNEATPGDQFMAIVEQVVQPLAVGDRLNREDFLRIWDSQPEIRKAELIGGIVYMPSPVAIDHGDMQGDVGCRASTYKSHTRGTAAGHNTMSFILEDVPHLM